MCAPFHPESGSYARIRGAQTSPYLFSLSLFSGNVPAGISATTECVRPNRSSIDSNASWPGNRACTCTRCVRASNRARTWVCTRSRVHKSFGEFAAANWSRLESYKLSRLPARIRAPHPPPQLPEYQNRSRGLEKGRGRCVWLVIWFTSGKNSATKLCLRLLLAYLLTA